MSDASVALRPATIDDAELLERRSREPHVIAATTDDSTADRAFEGAIWVDELANQSEVSKYLIAELDRRPIGAMQLVDPHLEPEHYWGGIEAGFRAIDIWIGPADALGKGYGREMMRLLLAQCFGDGSVTAVVIDPLASNIRAIRFYERLGFRATGRTLDSDDKCVVMELTRDAWRGRFPED